jgi:hypothetical protein
VTTVSQSTTAFLSELSVPERLKCQNQVYEGTVYHTQLEFV